MIGGDAVVEEFMKSARKSSKSASLRAGSDDPLEETLLLTPDESTCRFSCSRFSCSKRSSNNKGCS